MNLLSEKIWITRKARIYTEQRLLNRALLTQAVMIFYSFLLLSVSVWDFVYPSKGLEIYSIVSAIAVLASSILLSSQRYSERAMMIKNCYIRLDELYSKAKGIEKLGGEEGKGTVESEYTNILLNVENHSDYDFLSLRYSLRNNKETTLPKFTRGDYLAYFFAKSYRILASIIVFVLPFIISYVWTKLIQHVSIK